MASNYTVTGHGDFDTIFMSRASTKRADIGYQVGGTDISNRYEPSAGNGSSNADQISYNTGYKYNNTDLKYYFKVSGYSSNPAYGTLLSTYCSGVDKYGTYADGSGGTYNALIQSNSVDCGYVAPSTYNVTLNTTSNGSISFASGHGPTHGGGFYSGDSTTINASPATNYQLNATTPWSYSGGVSNPSTNNNSFTFTVTNNASVNANFVPTAGTLLEYTCINYNKYAIYADGSGGTYNTIIETNSSYCGYTPPAPTITINGPTDNSTFTAGQQVTLDITGDSSGFILTSVSLDYSTDYGNSWTTAYIYETFSPTNTHNATKTISFPSPTHFTPVRIRALAADNLGQSSGYVYRNYVWSQSYPAASPPTASINYIYNGYPDGYAFFGVGMQAAGGNDGNGSYFGLIDTQILYSFYGTPGTYGTECDYQPYSHTVSYYCGCFSYPSVPSYANITFAAYAQQSDGETVINYTPDSPYSTWYQTDGTTNVPGNCNNAPTNIITS